VLQLEMYSDVTQSSSSLHRSVLDLYHLQLLKENCFTAGLLAVTALTVVTENLKFHSSRSPFFFFFFFHSNLILRYATNGYLQ
jgi:hypothetical protein